MKRCLAVICIMLAAMLFSGALATEEPMPMDTPVQADEDQIDMLAVDHRLYELGYRDAECNGVLDDITINALKKFQTVNGLMPTGRPDMETVELLLSEHAVGQIEFLSTKAYEYTNAEVLKNGSYGDPVMKLQRALRELGYFSGKCDGVYGEATTAAVYRFQLANGLRESGAADGAMLLRLYEGDALKWDIFVERNCASVGDSGQNVRLIQIWLSRLDYFRGECSGKYGEGTQQAVREFQLENDLEASGDVDIETSRALFSMVDTVMASAEALSRGSAGVQVDALCAGLNALGYGAHAAFDMQTELALMKYQHINGLEVTGSATGELIAHMEREEAVSMDAFSAETIILAEEERSRMARFANEMIGQLTALDSDVNFAEYVFLKCGVGLPDMDALSLAELEAGAVAEPGSVVLVSVNGSEICGIAASDGAIIHQGEEGYIIISYLDMLGADRVFAADMEDEDAA